MTKTMFTYLLLALAAASASPAHAYRIYGGSYANIKDYPYTAAIEYNKQQVCGVSIISTTKVLTSAHCTHNLPAEQFQVRAGSTWRQHGGQLVKVTKIIEHPDLNESNFNCDLTVLILSEHLVLNEYVSTISLFEDADVPIGTLATLTGWGSTESNEPSHHLKKVKLPRSDDKLCADSYGSMYNTTTMVCYGGVVGRDACSSDYGGPLVVKGMQVGTVSYGPFTCGTSTPRIYVKLSYFVDFIINSN